MKTFFQVLTIILLFMTLLIAYIPLFDGGIEHSMENIQKGALLICITGIPAIISALLAISFKEK